jgi:hypothetical protein
MDFDGIDWEDMWDQYYSDPIDDLCYVLQMLVHGLAHLNGRLRSIEERLDSLTYALSGDLECGVWVERGGKLVEIDVGYLRDHEDLYIILDFEVPQ